MGPTIGPTWVLSALDGPQAGPISLAIREVCDDGLCASPQICCLSTNCWVLRVKSQICRGTRRNINTIFNVSSPTDSNIFFSNVFCRKTYYAWQQLYPASCSGRKLPKYNMLDVVLLDNLLQLCSCLISNDGYAMPISGNQFMINEKASEG